MQQPPERITITRERFEQLINVESRADDLLSIMLDFAGKRLKDGERLLEFETPGPIPKAIFTTALQELKEALTPPEAISA